MCPEITQRYAMAFFPPIREIVWAKIIMPKGHKWGPYDDLDLGGMSKFSHKTRKAMSPQIII